MSISQLRKEMIRGGLAVTLVSLGCNVGALAVPIYNMEVFDRVMTTHNMKTLLGLSVGLAISLVYYSVLEYFRAAASTALADRLAAKLLPTLLRVASLAGRDAAAAPTQAVRDAETLRSFISGPILTAPLDLLWCPVLLVVLFIMGWGFAAIAITSIFVLAILSIVGDVVARRPMTVANTATADYFRNVVDATRAAEAVIAMGMLPGIAKRWEQSRREASILGTQALLRSRSLVSLTRALRSGMTGAMVAGGLVMVLNGYAGAGSLVASNMILAKLLAPFEHFAATLRQWADAVAAWRRVQGLLRDVVPSRYSYALPRPEGKLAVEGLVFMPSGVDKPIIRGISFQVDPGESVGIIGPSASGKSALLKLLLGINEPTSGGVFLDGHSTFLWNREDFARHVGYVPQSAILTDATVAENIARSSRPDLDAVTVAAKQAGIHFDIAALPQGYATRISGRGMLISAGQRQRIAIARALYGSPQLLVLDEPDAFLDTEGEVMLETLIATLRAQGTGVLISTHRQSVVRSVDKLLVLNRGLVEHFGPRDTVMDALAGPRIRLVRSADKATA